MDAKKLFKAFLNDLNNDFDKQFKFSEEHIQEFEQFVTPKILKILQRDKTLFHEPFEFCDQELSSLLRDPHEKYWKHIQSCSFASFLSGDIKGKLSKFLESFKGF